MIITLVLPELPAGPLFLLMFSYIIRRLLLLVVVVLIVVTAVFFLRPLMPGDPARTIAGLEASSEDIEHIREKYGLDKPLYVQYFVYLNNLTHGDLGRSIRNRVPVAKSLLHRFPATLELAGISILMALVFAIFAGVLAATHHNSIIDIGTMIIALFGVSTPSFWRGLMLILVFALFFGWFPPSGRGNPYTLSWLTHLVLPSFTLFLGAAAYLTRLTRSSLLEILDEKYIQTARSKGLSERIVVYKHALRNALIPTFTMAGVKFGHLLAGTVVVETVFSWPGMGRMLLNGILDKDFPVIQGGILLYAISLALVNLLVDLSYAVLDPKIRYT